jgi:hypothetical protein
MIEQQFTLYLENKPGMLATVTGKLAAAKVNIEGISASTSADVGLVQIVTSDAAAARKALRRASIPLTVQDVALVQLKNVPGALSQVVANLAKAKINVNYVYSTACACRGQGDCYAVISAPDLKKVEAAWRMACRQARRRRGGARG